jgi:hypothetical protein
MKRNTSALVVAAAGLLGAASMAAAQHQGDVILEVQDGKIVTGMVDDFGQPQYPHYVWSENFGSAGWPNFAADPGYDSPAGAFVPGTVVGLSIRRALRVWDADEEHFDDIPDETISISRLSNTITTPAADPGCEALSSLALGAANASGIIHIHPDYFLNAPHGAGVYLLELEVWADAEGVSPSDPFWIVFNQNMAQPEVADAVAWVYENLAGPQCIGDINGDGVVDVSDLLLLLTAWGENPNHPADINGDCVVDVSDLLMLLGSWGACP